MSDPLYIALRLDRESDSIPRSSVSFLPRCLESRTQFRRRIGGVFVLLMLRLLPSAYHTPIPTEAFQPFRVAESSLDIVS